MSSLLKHLASFKPFTALVIGDLMLDRLTHGDVDRLCNDAPVPVLAVQRTDERAGGAANVCLDLAAMRGTVHALGVTGNDAAAQTLRDALKHAGIGVSGIISDASRPTTVKQSLIGLAQHRHAQKMFRLDYESREPISQIIADAILAEFAKLLPGADIVAIEDYAKGVCTPYLCQQLIALTRSAGKQILVDPAAISDYSRYRGCTTMTPNRAEAELAAGKPHAEAGDAPKPEAYTPLAEKLLRELQMDASLITLDKQGALLLERDADGAVPAQGRVVPTVARQIYDVTGAGDMVLAALCAARANHFDWFDAVRFANAAAGLEVEQFGVVPIPLEQIHRDILSRERVSLGKLRTINELKIELAAIRGGMSRGTLPAGKSPQAGKVVLANGCFDVLHAGHVSLLRRAAALGEYLIVAVNDDAGVRKLKGPTRPIYPIEDRAALLGELECVFAVVVFSEDTPERLIHEVRPDVLVKGAQYEVEKIPGARFVLDHGGTVELLEVVPGRSTTATVGKIQASA